MALYKFRIKAEGMGQKKIVVSGLSRGKLAAGALAVNDRK